MFIHWAIAISSSNENLDFGIFRPTCLSFIEESRHLNPGSLAPLINSNTMCTIQTCIRSKGWNVGLKTSISCGITYPKRLMKSLLRMPRINDPANNRIPRTTGIRQQRQYSLSYPHQTGRFPRPSYYWNVPILVLVVFTLNQINLLKSSNMETSRILILRTSPIQKTPAQSDTRPLVKELPEEQIHPA